MLTVNLINGFVPNSDGFPVLTFGSGPGAFLPHTCAAGSKSDVRYRERC
jgi:hypothetical protein